MLAHSDDAMLEYYRYLNSGYRLPLVGGTDKMSSAVPVARFSHTPRRSTSPAAAATGR
jgi:hypothetical protein